MTAASSMLNPCVSGCSSPTPASPAAAHRSTSASASSPHAGFTDPKASSRPPLPATHSAR